MTALRAIPEDLLDMSTSFPASLDALRQSLAETELPETVVAHLVAQARPALVLATSAADEAAIPLGATKIGGSPDLPPGMAWPTRPAYPDAAQRAQGHRQNADRTLADSKKKGSWMTPAQGKLYSEEYRRRADAVETEFPLTFLGQFNLAELLTHAGFDAALPNEGRLLVFYDFLEQAESFSPAASVGWRVLWDATPAAALVRAPVPEALSSISDEEWTCVFRAAPASAQTVYTPIQTDDASWDAFDLDDEESCDAYEDWLEQFGTPDNADRDNHQLGGFPQTIQRGMQETCQLVANGLYCGSSEVWQTEQARKLMASAHEWRLVLQIGADPNAGIPQPGAYYVTMREEDIAARRFDRARLTYQCD